MNQTWRWLGVCAIGALLACSDPPAPPAAPTPERDLRLVSLAPAPGATLDVIVCTIGMTRPLCSPDASASVAATYDQDIALASIFTEYFTADGRRCASGSAPSARMTAGREQSFIATPAFVSFRTDEPPLCTLPVTTSRVRLILADVSTSEFRRLVSVDVEAAYTFRATP